MSGPEGMMSCVDNTLALVPVHAGNVASIAPDPPAPHLPLETVQALGTGLLQMQPEVVFAAALLASDDE